MVATSATGSVSGSSGREARAHACAFGKHPAWDDHIEDIGLDNDRLVWIKRVLYAEGIAGNIDSGAWEKMEEPKRLPAFNHRFYWRTPEGLIVGRMWSSRDGKGRTKYPMVVCAWVEGAPETWAVEQISSRLERLEQTVKQTDNADLVRLSVSQLQRELASAAAVVLGSQAGDSTALLSRLLESPALDASGQKSLGLLRVVYEIERELAAFKTGTSFLRKGDASGPKAQHLRVPTCLTESDGVGAGPRAWLAVMDQEMGRGVPVLVLEPIGESFIDIIVGEAGPSMFFCTRASAQGLAPTTEVPYSLDQAFVERATAKIQAWKDAALVAGKVPVKAASKAPARPDSSGASSGAASRRSNLPLIIGGAALGAAALIGITIFALGGKSEPKAPPTPPTPTGEGARDHQPAVTPSTNASSTAATPVAPPTPAANKNPGANAPQVAPSVPAPSATQPSVPTPSATPPIATKPVDAPNATKPVAPTHDPRIDWRAAERAATLRERLALLAGEQAAQGQPTDPEALSRLERLEKQIGLLSARGFSLSNRDALARDLGVVDGELSDIEAGVDQAIAQLRSRVRESLASRAGVAPVQSPALVRAWTTAMAQIDPAIGWAAADAKANELARALKAVEQDLRTAEITIPQGATIDQQAIITAAERRRASALEASAAAILGSDQARLAETRAELQSWSTAAQQFVADAGVLEAALAMGTPSGEPATVAGANGRSPSQVADQIRSSSVYRELAPAVAPIMAKLGDLSGIEQGSDRATLMAIIADSSRPASQGVAAARRLAVLGPADDVAGLEAFVNAMTAGAQALSTRLTDAADRDAIRQLGAETAKDAWQSAVPKLARDEAGLRTLVALGEKVKATEADIAQWPPFARLNLARLGLVDAAKLDGPGAAKLATIRARIGAFAQLAESIPDVDTAAMRAALAPIIESKNDLDFAAIGPATAGWKLEEGAEDGSRAVYSWTGPNGAHRVEFLRVLASTDGEESPAYLAKNEASVGLVLDLMGEKLGWENVRTQKALRLFRPGDTDPRRGVRTWDWQGDPTKGEAKAIISKAQRGNLSLGWMGYRAGMDGTEWYPTGNPGVPGGPSADSPMVQVGVVSSMLAAHLAGCRLPTLAEWQAAAGVTDTLPADAATTSNLRDASWKRVFDHLVQHTSKQPHFPSSGVFHGDAESVTDTEDSAPAVTTDDGVVWFAPVQTAVGTQKGQFVHLIGNAAEFVTASDSIGGGAATYADLKKAVQAADVRVVGASALSSGREPLVSLIPGRNWAEQTYADVGFRLAFGAPKSAVSAASATKQLEDALAKHGYVAP